MAAGATYADVPESLRRYRSDIFTDKYKRLEWGQLSRTVTAHIAKDGYWYIHPEQHRTLSIREAARLQTFPDGWRFAGSPSHRYAQIGNAVPPMAGEAIARAVLGALASPAVASRRSRAPSKALTAWHEDRPGPDPAWRASGATPWAALVGELVLSRTPRSTADAIFRTLIGLAATPVETARRSKEELVATGLSSTAVGRIRSLRARCVSLFDGEVPSEDVELQLLPGVGMASQGRSEASGTTCPRCCSTAPPLVLPSVSTAAARAAVGSFVWICTVSLRRPGRIPASIGRWSRWPQRSAVLRVPTAQSAP